MLTCYDLYDLHAIFVSIRSCPPGPLHEPVLTAISEVLARREICHELNQFRAAVRPLLASDSQGLYAFCRVDNVYTHSPHPPLKDARAYRLLATACDRLRAVVRAREDEHIAALSDCLHNLPLYLAENHGHPPRDFWKREVRAYRRQWDEGFLSAEESLFR